MIPTYGCTHAMHLSLYISSIFVDPLPTFIEKFFSTEFMSSCSWFLNSFFYFCLCGYSCMIGSWYPECWVSLHTMISCHNIFESECQCMPDMEISCNIWGWNWYIETFSCFWFFRRKTCIITPEFLDTFFRFFWVILFWEFWHKK